MGGGLSLDINQFIYFGEICRVGSLSKAAENLHISQQGLSLSLKRLEKELGCQLFSRRPSGLELTEAGMLFRKESEAAMEHINRIYQYCQTANGSKSRITVACTINLITRIPVKLRQLLLRGNEDFEINFIEDWTSNCETMVADNRANFGLVYGPCNETQFQSTTLDVLKQVFIVNRKVSTLAQRDTVSLTELANYPLIVPDERCRPGLSIRAIFETAGVPLNIAYACDRPQQIIDLVANDDMAARVILDDVTESDLTKIKVLTLRDDPFLLPICLIYKKGRKLSMQERFFTHLVMDNSDGEV